MGHGITDSDTMIYYGAKPWHGIGTELKEVFTSDEALKIGSLDFTVVLVGLTTDGIIAGSKTRRNALINKPVDDYYATVRSDTNKVLGVVGSRYKVVQNRDAFTFFDGVVGGKQAIYHTVGTINEGRMAWILAKLPGDIRVKNSDDITKKYLLLVNSHDGSSALKMFFTPIRVVCQNTLNFALDKNKTERHGLSLRHTLSIGDKMINARKALQLADAYYTDFQQVSDLLANKPIDSKTLGEFLSHLFPINIIESPESLKNMMLKRSQVTRLFETGMGNNQPAIKNTAWALMNAVSEYSDHGSILKTGKNSSINDARLKSIWFGTAANLKQKAFDELIKIAK